MFKNYIDPDGVAHTDSLEGFQKRMLVELWELSYRSEKLKNYLSSRDNVKSLDPEQLMWMAKQQLSMMNYATCLFERFKLMDIDPTDFKPEDIKALAEQIAEEEKAKAEENDTDKE